jgi:hypothetical protein
MLPASNVNDERRKVKNNPDMGIAIGGIKILKPGDRQSWQ